MKKPKKKKERKKEKEMREFAAATGAAITNPESMLDSSLRSCRDQSRNYSSLAKAGWKV